MNEARNYESLIVSQIFRSSFLAVELHIYCFNQLPFVRMKCRTLNISSDINVSKLNYIHNVNVKCDNYELEAGNYDAVQFSLLGGVQK